MSEQKNKLVPAEMHKRFLNYLIDYYIQILIFTLFFLLLLIIFHNIPFDLDSNIGANLLVSISMTIGYYTFFETRWGKTPGKFITKTKVITTDGKKPDCTTVLKRSLLRCIPFEIISFLVSKNPSGWHDKFSDTIVIDETRSTPSTKSGLAMFGLLLGEYVVTGILYIVIFVVIALIAAFIVPRDALDNYKLEHPSPIELPLKSSS